MQISKEKYRTRGGTGLGKDMSMVGLKNKNKNVKMETWFNWVPIWVSKNRGGGCTRPQLTPTSMPTHFKWTLRWGGGNHSFSAVNVD